MSLPKDQADATRTRIATKLELDAAISTFEAAVWWSNSGRLSATTEAAHAALQAHLDAIAGVTAIARRGTGL